MDNSMKAFLEHQRLENLDRHFRADRRRPQTILTVSILLTRPSNEKEDNFHRLEIYQAKKELIKRNIFPALIFTAENSVIREMVK